MIDLRGAAVGYDNRPTIQGIDFTLTGGEVLAVLGPNGAGKSTLIRGILGLAPMLAGTLHLFGTPASRFKARHRLGYVPQRHTVTGGVPSTVAEVVASGRLPLRRPFVPSRAADRSAVRDALLTVGLADLANVSLAALSGGQQRRVLIARALAAQPDVLVMDEPTAGVDAATQQALADTLAGLIREGRTLLLVAHELGPLASLISRVVVLRDGTITYDGPPAADGPGAHHRHDPTAHDHHLPDPSHDLPGITTSGGAPWPGRMPTEPPESPRTTTERRP